MNPPKDRESTVARVSGPKRAGNRNSDLSRDPHSGTGQSRAQNTRRSAPQALTAAQRQFLKALAHSVKPVVIIGSGGLTAAVMAETNRALARHELVKVKAASDDRALRAAWIDEIAGTLAAAPVAHIGKILVLFRPAEKPRIVLPR
jgi:RNA-binding protein